MAAPSTVDTVVSLCKRRGFVFPCGEIYGGTRSAWDYGPLGVELKENIKRQWWKAVVTGRDDVGAAGHHRLPPLPLDVLLELDAQRAVVPRRPGAAVDLPAREHEPATLAQGDDGVDGGGCGHAQRLPTEPRPLDGVCRVVASVDCGSPWGRVGPASKAMSDQPVSARSRRLQTAESFRMLFEFARKSEQQERGLEPCHRADRSRAACRGSRRPSPGPGSPPRRVCPVPTPRRNIESTSLPVITWLNGLPRALPFLAILALMVAGILVPGWGWVLLLVVVLFLVWTFYLSWPALDGVNKLMRGTVIVLAIAITITQAIPKG